MKTIASVLLLALSFQAHAEELQFDLTGFAGFAGPTQTPFEATFLLDTSSGAAQLLPFTQDNGTTCMAAFKVSGMTVSNASVNLGGQVIALPNASGGTWGTNFGGSCPGFFNTGLDITSAGYGLAGTSNGSSPFPGHDPVTSLLLGFPDGAITMDFVTPTGNMNVAITGHVTSVTSVPEPAMLALLLLGLAGAVARRYGMISHAGGVE